VLGLPDHNFQTALGKAIEYEKLNLLEDFGKPDVIRGTVFQWVSYYRIVGISKSLIHHFRLFQAQKNARSEKKSMN